MHLNAAKIILNQLEMFWVEGTTKTKYKFGLFKRLLCPNNKDANFIANFKKLS